MSSTGRHGSITGSQPLRDVHRDGGDGIETETFVDRTTHLARLQDRHLRPGISRRVHRCFGNDSAESLATHTFECSDTEDAGEAGRGWSGQMLLVTPRGTYRTVKWLDGMRPTLGLITGAAPGAALTRA